MSLEKHTGQLRGSCSHFKAAWDTHVSCLNCCRCSSLDPCAISAKWSQDTWLKAQQRRTYAQRKEKSLSRASSNEVSLSSTTPPSSGVPAGSDKTDSVKTVPEGSGAVGGVDSHKSQVRAMGKPASAREVVPAGDGQEIRTGKSPNREERFSQSEGNQRQSSRSKSPKTKGSGSESESHSSSSDRSDRRPSRGRRRRSRSRASRRSAHRRRRYISSSSDRSYDRSRSHDRDRRRPHRGRSRDRRQGRRGHRSRRDHSRDSFRSDRSDYSSGRYKSRRRSKRYRARSRSRSWSGSRIKSRANSRARSGRAGQGRTDQRKRSGHLDTDRAGHPEVTVRAGQTDRAGQSDRSGQLDSPGQRNKSDSSERFRSEFQSVFVDTENRSGPAELIVHPRDQTGSRSVFRTGDGLRIQSLPSTNREDFSRRDSGGVLARARNLTAPPATAPNPESAGLQFFENSDNQGRPRGIEELSNLLRPFLSTLSGQAHTDTQRSSNDSSFRKDSFVLPTFDRESDSEGSVQGSDPRDQTDTASQDPLLARGVSNLVTDSEQNAAKPDPYCYPLNKVYDLIFDTVSDDICCRPVGPQAPKPGSALEASVRQDEPDRDVEIRPTASRLPLSPAVLLAMQRVEEDNKGGKTPWSTSAGIPRASEYRAPLPDKVSGFDLGEVPRVDSDISKGDMKKPSSTSEVKVPWSLLESWETRERRSLGLVSQLDFIGCAIKSSIKDSESYNEDLRNLMIYLGRTISNLAVSSSANLAEQLRLRRDKVLGTIGPGSLTDEGMTRLRSAPLTANSLFADQVKEVVTSDKDDQVNVFVANTVRKENNKRPAQSGYKGAPFSKKRFDPKPTVAPALSLEAQALLVEIQQSLAMKQGRNWKGTNWKGTKSKGFHNKARGDKKHYTPKGKESKGKP